MKALKVRVEQLFLDRGSDDDAVIGCLSEQPFPTGCTLTGCGGEQGETGALLKGAQELRNNATPGAGAKTRAETFTVHVAYKYEQGPPRAVSP